METGVISSIVQKVHGDLMESGPDLLAVEEPLEIRIVFGPAENRDQKNLTVTMRTPGHDAELALGFLFTEGIISSGSQVENIRRGGANEEEDQNVICVTLSSAVRVDFQKLQRNFYTTSSCGVCGKSSIDAVRMNCNVELNNDFIVIPEVIQFLPEKLISDQTIFGRTGGLHAVGLFDSFGVAQVVREDVGRHNAFDKVVGESLMKNMLPLSNSMVMVSGRASFELVQKAALAGIPVFAAVGAPSSLAVDLAKQVGMTLLGFVRDDRFNIYCGESRVRVK